MKRIQLSWLVVASAVVVAACGGTTATTNEGATVSPGAVTTSPVRSAPPTTGAVTTSPVRSAPPTTGAVTTSPVRSAPPTTGSITTSPVAADCPEILAVEMQETSAGVFTISTTVRSVDIEGVSYADAWEVRDQNGTVLGTRILTHPHANEQPFTRSLSGVAIPSEVLSVEVAARDSVRGFCGVGLTVAVPHS